MGDKGMYIFIDESGVFCEKTEADVNLFSPDCVVAVCFSNDASLEKWIKKYGNIEKGSKINEEKAEEILSFLDFEGVKAFIVAINSGACSGFLIDDLRNSYIITLREYAEKQPNLRDSFLRHVDYLENMNNQQLIKVMLIMQVIENSMRGIISKESTFTSIDLQKVVIYCDEIDSQLYSTVKYLTIFQFWNHSYFQPLDLNFEKIPLDWINQKGNKKYLKFSASIEFKSDDEFMGIKAADCVANFTRRFMREHLFFSNVIHLKNIFNLPFSHFLYTFGNDSFCNINELNGKSFAQLKDIFPNF